MACTKQTPAKSKGGSAPRVQITKLRLTLAPKTQAQTLRVAKAIVPAWQATEMVRARSSDVAGSGSGVRTNHFCMLCQDGADEDHTIFECDEPDCPRVVCTRCISFPSKYSQELMQSDVTFRCLHCHTALDKKAHEVTPYHGFFKDGNPVLSSFIRITGQLELSKRSQISMTPILIVHFRIIGCEKTVSPIDAVHGYLAPYFPFGGLHLVDVVFDLGTSRKIDDYRK
ncbi:uncharacterized protein F5891DRAFT_1188872 [Suillus fuscotomentosus]|uniref:Uncharacterized protein n=1 Tax=Suillus fuscotomentosus TaxID=1912939 RepID=A0AAD4E5N9_9AGAM|nr:uncharacterized protein F5891DRAFT_1188872 [Suillus fuscotomentosus]KAG1900174.1 hypothetical protein F5891DRAFT_1188872 [Suillus fuscotomentosus]